MLEHVRRSDPELAAALDGELSRQRNNIELIASENFVSRAVLEAQGSVLTNKYAEGYPGKRYYGGCEWVDVAESLAISRARELFGAEHANVQPHAGAPANSAVYLAFLKPGDTVLGMDLSHGGHLTHGHPLNYSGIYFNFIPYGVRQDTETIDYDALAELARKHRPKMIVAGASAYPRTIDFERMAAVAKEIDAMLMVDMAHIAGLVAADLHPNPVPHADLVTTTTHKTLRGPRGGLILCREKYAREIDRAVFPGLQGGPLMHIIAAKAVAFKEALTPEFRAYQAQIIRNAAALAHGLQAASLRIVSGGTDNHLMLVDLRGMGLNGRQAEKLLDECHITVNKNTIPFDPEPPMRTSGLRIGTPAVTTRGMDEPAMAKIAELIAGALRGRPTEEIRQGVAELAKAFPLYDGLVY